MLADLPILSLIAFSPLLGVLLLLFMPKDNGKWIKIIGIAATIIPLILAGWLYAEFNHQLGTMQFEENYRWISIDLSKELEQLSQFQQFTLNFNFNIAVDGLSLPMVFLTALVSTMAALASIYIKKRWKTYFILFLILEVGMFGVFMAQDVFLFFLFFEIALVPVFFLIGIWGYHNREKAANKFLIYNGIGSALMLIAFLILVTTAGFVVIQGGAVNSVHFSGSLQDITHNLFYNPDALIHTVSGPQNPNPFYLGKGIKWTIFSLLFVAFAIKLPIFPFHTWMLKVHSEAPPSIVMIHSGILLKMGAYGLIRFGVLLFPGEAKEWAYVIGLLGLINIIYGAILAFVQKDFKLVLAYSSISHMGIVLLGIAAFNVIGLQGAVFQMVSHGLISALMFLIVGSIYERTQTTQIDELGGLAKSMPFMSGILLIGGMASLGLPGLSGFISEFLAFLGLFDSMPIITIISTAGIILTAVYVLRGVLKITYGPMSEAYASIRDVRLMEAIPMITLVAFILLIGLFPAVLSEPLQATVVGFNDFIHTIAMKMGG
ncbi:NADH-quinone oxidoreductase subunit M [Paenibacillus psychroresistens]|uniref:NADH-quinone oxidoreductase subunit M n=1 Tax=Paenibacillus psychroresistens TaxID=1778678 RepID=A0A6B8RDE4_9BACL|nr:NADH-quinone oxidoreductase subunit M [Paenibacillus psychroresistens]QGQ93488.1 NADH-quinone oxidoreductase subunit M [Paenibacillus psychroresistens]